MRTSALTIFALIVIGSQINFPQSQSPLTGNNSCINCHTEMEFMPTDYNEIDVHMNSEISCQGCHGGDPTSDDEEISMSPQNGFKGVPENKDIPSFCGKCHSDIKYMRSFKPRMSTDQEAQYYTSQHGIKLKTGDENVATCVSCHTSHSILPVTDPRSSVYAVNIPKTCDRCHGNKKLMDSYKLPSNQFEEYSLSVHGNALLVEKDTGAPACNDCHGNHGALPPGLESISHVCGICHVNNMEYFNASSMSKPFEEMDFHACEQCHGNHLITKTNDKMIGVSDEALCIDCHNSGDDGYSAAETISRHLYNFVSLYDSAQVKFKQVKIKGMNDVDIGFLLKDANQNLIQTRTLIHTFDTTKVVQKINEGVGFASKAIESADEQIDEYYRRRNGFAIATLAFLILAIALFLKVRQFRKQENS